MIDGSTNGMGELDRLIGRVRDLQRPPMGDLAQTLRHVVDDGMRRLESSGLDVDGNRLAPLAESTRRKPGRADGTPLHPGGRHPFADSMTVEVAEVGTTSARLVCAWGHPAAGLTKRGTQHQPARNIFGFDARTRAELADEARRFGRDLVGGDRSLSEPGDHGVLIKQF